MTTTQRGEGSRVGETVGETGRTGGGTTSSRGRRVALGVLGGALVVAGLRRRSLRGAVLAVAGGGLLATAFGGYEQLQRAIDSRPVGDGQRGDRTARTAETAASRSVTVGKSPDELYEMWRDPDRVSIIVGHFADVTASDGDRFRWTMDGPAGREMSWETRFVDEQPGEFLRWKTPGDATVPNEGTVRFSPAPGDRGTVVTLSVDFDPPGGSLGTAVLERLEIVPEALVGVALDRFKSLAETGEVPTLEKNPSGRGRGDLL